MNIVIDELLDKYPEGKRENLIPILQEIQERTGLLSEESITMVAQHLHLPASKIYGLATFYDNFRFETKGIYHFRVCLGTACYVVGSQPIFGQLEKLLKIKAGQKSKDGWYSLEVVPCMGSCSLGPVISVNGDYYSKVTFDSLKEIISAYPIKK
jgi:NADH:ubiquinone oxidoreductase subunit E